MKNGKTGKVVGRTPEIHLLIRYIAKRNPNGIRQLAYKHGYPSYNSYKGSLNFIHKFLKTEGEKGFDDLMMQHPDIEIILEVHNLKQSKELKLDADDFNFSGKEIANGMEVITTEEPHTENAIYGKLASLIAFRRDQVLQLLSKYDYPVPDEANKEKISENLIKAVKDGGQDLHYELATEITRLEHPETLEFAPIIGKIADGLGGIAGKIFNNKSENSSGALLASIKQKRLDQKEAKQSRKDKNALILGVAITASALILVIVVVMLLR